MIVNNKRENIGMFKYLILLCALALFLNQTALAAWRGIASEVTQIQNNVQLGLQVKKQIETYRTLQNQFLAYQYQVQVLKKHVQEKDLVKSFVKLYGVYKGGELIRGKSMDISKDFKALYAGYDISGPSAEIYEMDQQARQSAETALARVNLTYEQALDEGQLLRNLQNQNRTVDSQNALIQSGNDIALLGITQSRRLEALAASQNQLQAEHIAREQSEKVSRIKAHEDWRKREREWGDRLRKAREERKGKGKRWKLPSSTD